MDKIKKALIYAKENTEYYKNIDCNNIENNKVINKKTYVENTYPNSKNMEADCKTAKFVFSTSGTTNNPQYIIRDIEDINYQINDYIGLDINENDRILNLFWGGIWGVYTTNNLTLAKTKSTIIPYGGNNISNLEQLDKVIRDLNINTIFGVPSTITYLCKYYSEKDNIPNITKIFCLGEKMDIKTYEYIKSVFKDVNIKTKYGCMESAGIGYQCSNLNCNEYHIFDNRYVEIINPETEEICKEKEIGKIIVTTLNERLVPLVRYDTGDIGYIENRKCSCGNHKVLTILNRNDDEFIVASVHISKKTLYNIIDELNSTKENYQVEIDKYNNLDRITINYENENLDINSISSKIYKENPDLLEVINNHKMNDILFKKINIEKNKISGKSNKFIDRR